VTFKTGDRVRVVAYPEQRVVGISGVVIAVDAADDLPHYVEVSLDHAPEFDRPWRNDYLFLDDELECI
jgi:hypothetical protein